MTDNQDPVPTPPFRLGPWEVRRDEGLLSDGDRAVRLEPRVMDVLVHLAANPDRVVSKEELLTVVWDGAFVEEGALAQAIHSLRKALGDDARQPRFIQTVPKRGYRLVVVVEKLQENLEAEVGSPSTFPPNSASMSRWNSRPWLYAVLATLLVALVLGIIWVVEWHNSRKVRQDIRIVVLPFENIGEPGDPFFAAGLTEEITANLTLLSLQVIPGKNALGAEGVTKPLPEIEKELKVDYVLGGAVDWRAGSRQVRVRPQLIRMSDKVIVFGNPFEGRREDLFKAQQEISRAVISTLDITLTLKQSLAVGERSTRNSGAYRAYVQGLVMQDQPFYSIENLEKAALMFQQAIDFDPKFAEAWAELSQVHSYLAFNTDRTAKRKEQAREAMEQAVALGPDLVATHLAQAYFSYRCLENYDSALEHLSAAERIAPNIPKVLETHGLLLRRKGHLPEALAILKKAAELNPRTADLVWTIAETYGALRKYEQADIYFERAIALAPDISFNYEQRALNRLCWTGNTAEARGILEDLPVNEDAQLELVKFYLDLDERKYRQALERLSSESLGALNPDDQSRIAARAVVARLRIDDVRGALILARENLADARLRIEQFPGNRIYRAYLAVALAQLGSREEAIAEAEQAAAQNRHDAFSGPQIVEVQAMVDSILGRHREAIARLDRLLAASYRDPICTAKLRLDPVWDDLRDDDGFKNLLRKYDRNEAR